MATYRNKVPYYFEATNIKHLNAIKITAQFFTHI